MIGSTKALATIGYHANNMVLVIEGGYALVFQFMQPF